MSGPDRAPEAEADTAEAVPGHFVSDDLRDDCVRFLDQVRRMVDCRRENTWGNPWFPHGPPP